MSMSSFPDESRAKYQPAVQFCTHAGEQVPEDMDFFVDSPPEIGEIVSGYSTLKKDQQPLGWGKRLAIAGGAALVIMLLVEILIVPNVEARIRGGWRIGEAIAAVSAALIAVACTGFSHTCSYIGRAGIIRFTLKRNRDEMPRIELLPFAAATELRTATTRHYTNGAYTGTSYNYTWTDNSGRKLLTLSGRYHSKEGFPKGKDPFHFARVAELVWSDYLFDSLGDQLEKQGFIQFNLSGSNWVRVGPEFLECCQKGTVARITKPEIREIKLNNGQFTVYHHDARWYSSAGKYSFDYASMANGRLFVIALERLLGYSF